MKDNLKKDYPGLFEYLQDYGMDEKFVNNIDRVKGNSLSGYYVVGSLREDGNVELLDISNTPDHFINNSRKTNYQWNMLNDGIGPITQDEWKKMKIDPYCEYFTIPGSALYGE